MSEPSTERFALSAPPPVRPFAIASLLAIIGAALAVSSRALGLGSVALVVGIVGLALAAALVLSAVIVLGRLRATLVLDADGITMSRGRRTRRLLWSDIDSVGLAGQRLTFRTKPAGDEDVSVINPRSGTDPTFTSLVAAIRDRLNASRGYRTS